VRGLLTLGKNFGRHGGLDIVHDLILRCRKDLAQFQFVTKPTLSALESAVTFDDNIIYAVIHEAVYCEGIASKWSADRVGRSIQQFQWLAGSPQSASNVRDAPLFFSGEMIFPFMFDIFPELEKIAQVADIIANYSGWPELYDEWQLARNEVPLYAATYVDDSKLSIALPSLPWLAIFDPGRKHGTNFVAVYVDFGLAQDTVKLVKNCKQFITNTMYHDAVRSKTDAMLKELFALRDDSID